MNLVIDGKIMSLKEIKKYFTPLEKYKEIIVHCGSGITGTINYLWKKQAQNQNYMQENLVIGLVIKTILW